jgi:hypothetical protein
MPGRARPAVVGTVTSGAGGAPEDAQQMPGRAVAEHGTGSAREHGRHVVAMHRRREVPDRVDAAMHATQASVAEPSLDAPGVHAGRQQLRPADPAVLAGRDPRRRVEQSPHVGV